MKLGGTKLFNDKEKLYEMVNLRRIGWAETSLSLYFGCDIESISTKCKKYFIEPDGPVFTIERIARNVLPSVPRKPLYRISGGEKVCMGRSYKDYLIPK